MTHLEIVFHGAPEKHEEFIHQVNQWRYAMEGPVTKGHLQPYIAEIRTYDIRVKEELVDQFCSDMRLQNIEDTIKGAKHGPMHWVVALIGLPFKLLRWITPLKGWDRIQKRQMHVLRNPYYAYILAKVDDNKEECVITKKKKEVL